MATLTYKGFTTQSDALKAYDIDLAKQDLLNHFMTRKGERVMAPEFGTNIWELLFDPLTPELQNYIKRECESIVAQDIRFQYQGTQVLQVPNGFTLVIRLVYLPDNLVTDLQVNFDANSAIQ